MNMFCEVFMYVHYRIYSFLEKIIMQWNTTYTEKLFVTSKNMYILMNLRENEFASNWLPKMRFVALGNNYWPIPMTDEIHDFGFFSTAAQIGELISPQWDILAW